MALIKQLKPKEYSEDRKRALREKAISEYAQEHNLTFSAAEKILNDKTLERWL